MTESQKKLADDVVTHFKKIHGLHLNADELTNALNSTKKEIQYIAAILSVKGILNHTETLVLSQMNVIGEKYFLTDKGWDYANYDTLLEEEQQKAALEEKQKQSIIKTNESVQATNSSLLAVNESTKSLNDKIIPKNFEDQRKFGNRSLWLALISVIFIALTFWQQYQDKTESKLQDLSSKADSLHKEMQNIDSSLRKINSSILKMKMDSLP